MKKFQKLIKGLILLAKHPYFINKLIDDNDAWKKSFEKRHPKFTKGLPVINLEQVIESDELKINYYSFLDGGSLITDLALLKGLAANIKDCKYFEIGTWRGESVVNVSEEAMQCYTLNLSEKEMRDMHGNENIISQIGLFINNQHTNIQKLQGNTFEFNFSQFDDKFDLVFIDGDHTYNGICNDTQKVLGHIVHDKTIIVWHDYGYSPDVLRYEVMSAVLDSVPEKKWPHLYHVRNTKCCIYHPGIKMKGSTLQSPDFPIQNFKSTINIKRL